MPRHPCSQKARKTRILRTTHKRIWRDMTATAPGDRHAARLPHQITSYVIADYLWVVGPLRSGRVVRQILASALSVAAPWRAGAGWDGGFPGLR